jgi:tight adherence protein C
MTILLMLICAVGIGWFLRDVVNNALIKMDQDRQRRRLNNIVQQKTAIPLQAYIEIFGEKFTGLLTTPFFERYLTYLEKQLRRADIRHLKAVDLLGYQLLASVVFSSVFGLLAGSVELAVLSFGAGLILPVVWLNDKAQKREKYLLRELPNALEILSLCSEAGLSLEQGMEQYLRNAKSGPLKEELTKIMDLTRSGSGRKKAFLSVTEKLDLTDFSLFSTSVIQAERFGTGIAKTLQQLSMTIRDKQSQRAEKAVQEMPVKLLFPLILFIMPVTFLIIFGPILLQFLNQ